MKTETELVETQTVLPWYRYPWVWFVFGIPFTAVLFGIVMIVSANYQRDDLVVDDYYQEGKGINQRLALDNEARMVHASVKLTALTDSGAVFQISGGSEAVQLTLFHVTTRDKDLTLPLVANGGGIYTAASVALATHLAAKGVWYLEFRDEVSGWRLRQRLVTPIDELTLVAS